MHPEIDNLTSLAVVAALLGAATPAAAQLPQASVLTVGSARQVAAAAEQEARRNGWNVVISVVDGGGHLIHLDRLDGTQIGSVEVAIAKARSAAVFRRPTKDFQDWVAGGAVHLMELPGAVPIEGGVPLIVDGQVVGAVGVSGASAAEDGQVAVAGARALASTRAHPAADDEAIRNVIANAYIGGIHRNESRAVARAGFHPRFVMFVRGTADSVRTVSIEEWLGRSPPEGTRPAHSVRYEVRVLEREQTAATARAEVYFNDKHVFTDFFLLYRLGGDWRIIGKVFHDYR